MAEDIFNEILTADISGTADFNQWFIEYFEENRTKRKKESSSLCSIEEFAVFFLNFLRNQTEEYLRGCTSQCNTPRKVSTSISQPVASQSHSKNVSRNLFIDSTQITSPIHPLSTNRNRSIGTDQSTKNFNDSQNYDRSFPTLNSTPIRNTSHAKNSFNSSTKTPIAGSPANSSFSPLINKSYDKSKKSFTSPLCLGDFINTASMVKQKGRKSLKYSSPSENSPTLSESDFPTIGHHRSKTTKIATNQPIIDVDATNSSKPRKRVAPITLIGHTNRNEFTIPSHRTENNLLNISQEDAPISRNLLRTHIDAISRDFENVKLPERSLRAALQLDKDQLCKSQPIPVKINLDNVTHSDVLNKMIYLHSAIIDLHLTTNILTELSYLLNLLNIETDPFMSSTVASIDTPMPVDESTSDGNFIDSHLINHSSLNNTASPTSHTSIIATSSTTINTSTTTTTKPSLYLENIFKNVNNCVFYSLGVLSKQKHVLALLDCTTLKVLVENERLLEFNAGGIKEFLLHVYSHKLKLESIERTHNTSFTGGGGGGGVGADGPINVFYQQENDTKDNFPSIREFMAFRKQRDLFCSIFRSWEERHLNPSWIFEIELGSKVRSLINQSDHPINMAHLAKLFTSQLILCCANDAATPDLQMALPQADLSKLSKLQQRLTAPSSFSTDYLFPGNQLFFKDFLNATHLNCTFIEQLKLALLTELMERNSSSFETLILTDNGYCEEYVVRPETISLMKILAKFIGMIMAKPYSFDGLRNSTVDDRQIELRNKMCPQFDIKSILLEAVSSRRLLITIPWLVQYLAMLDYISLRLSYFTEIFNILYELYWRLSDRTLKLKFRPTSSFILKTCLGWLFEQPNVPDGYYKYRQNREFLQKFVEYTDDADSIPLKLEQEMLKYKETMAEVAIIATSPDQAMIPSIFDSILEQILIASCTFLADFRVSIMPPKYSKTVSRSGRFRHITTMITESSANQLTECDPQTKLIEAFLRTQSLSVRRTVEFITERTVSAVIKDFKMDVMVPYKQNATDYCSKIEPKDRKYVMKTMHECYTNAMVTMLKKWDEMLPQMIVTRAMKAFDALLPNETLPAVRTACISISVNRCKSKVQEWRTSNLSKLDFFSKDISADVEKLLQNKHLNKPVKSIEFKIDLTAVSPAELLGKLQMELHHCSLMPYETNLIGIQNLVNQFKECLTKHILPSAICRSIGFMILQLLQLLICNRSDLVSNDLINEFVNVWKCECLSEFTKPNNTLEVEKENEEIDENYKADDEQQQTLNDQRNSQNDIDTYIFGHVVSNCYMKQLENCTISSFEAFKLCLVQLIKNGFLTISALNIQCIRLLREEWPMDLLNRLSNLLRAVLDDITTNTEMEYDFLFLEMLSDLARDIDLF